MWLTADVHYAAAHLYNPDKAQFQEFSPFWEFVAGPLHAGTGSQNELDNTFGPEVKFAKAAPRAPSCRPPTAYQFFGHVKIEGPTGQMTVTLRDRNDVALWSTALDPKRIGFPGVTSLGTRGWPPRFSTWPASHRRCRVSAVAAFARTWREARHRCHIR